MGLVKVATSISTLSIDKSKVETQICKEFGDVFTGIGKLSVKQKSMLKGMKFRL